PAADWADLKAHATDEQYVRAEATFEGQPAGTIGLRFKGSFGTLVNCFDSSGRLTCAKLSFKVDFEEYDSTNRFFGLKRLNLHSMINDPTKLHERIAYELYQLSGVKAPRSTWANVKVNGENQGLFSLVEEIDGRFTAETWPGAGDGNLYKEVWPTSGMTSFVDGLQTNKSIADVSGMAAFADDLRGAPDAALATTLAKWTDPDYLNRYLAVDDAIVNCDGITAFYAPMPTGDAWGNHNFYWYQEPTRPYFWLIPWDMDMTMTTCSFFAAVPNWSSTPADCTHNSAVWGSSWVKPPGCDRLFQAAHQNHAGYAAAVDQLLAGPFAMATLMPKIDAWSAFIRPSVVADPTLGGDAAWQSAVAQLRATIPTLRARLLALRDGKPIRPVALALDALNDFEQTAAADVALGLTALSNGGSDTAVTLGTAGALSGAQDLRLDFTYRDPASMGGWQQWIYFPINFVNGPNDLTTVKTIRIRLATDRPRNIRVDLESGLYQQGSQGVKFGWDVAVTPTPTTMDLAIDMARLPSWGTATDDLATVRKAMSGLAFNPTPDGRGADGLLGAGNADVGFLRIDDVQFVRTP
ncbi:MAG TPA: CotH kinase family protein, partial [Polyangia bacterium]|nr:CotH kinase family protein [Polyangia bacterium]